MKSVSAQSLAVILPTLYKTTMGMFKEQTANSALLSSMISSRKRRPIWLQQLKDRQPQGFPQKPAGYMVFRVDLADDIEWKAIADWLKAAAPKQ